MATIIRKPFAPLNEARLQTLTSQKNRQNAILSSSPTKRKASDVTGSDNLENVDPGSFSKRAKGADGCLPSKDSFIKPATFVLTKSASINDVPLANPPQAATPRQRSLLNPKSPGAKLNANIARSSPLSASPGSSVSRRRSGLLSSRRRTAGSFTRVDPPVFGRSASPSVTPFSLDAALRGTIKTFTNRDDVSSAKQPSSSASDFSGLHEPELKPSWFFQIHEDTEAEEAANMLQHGTCTLDISSDEESEQRRQRERAEGKENLPPADDISQTSYPRAARRISNTDDMVIEKERSPLGEMDPRKYYSKGCDENSVIIVHDDDEETPAQGSFRFTNEMNLPVPAAETLPIEDERPVSAEELMQKADSSVSGAAVLEPVEGTGESFEVWESSSAKDEAEPASECC